MRRIPLPAPERQGAVGGRLNVAKALEGPDSIAPGPIVDLVALTATSNGVPLQWTATGDDGTSGTVTAYDIRYSSFEITEANFESATPYRATLDPHPPGSQELVVVKGLDFSTTYYFAIKARDEYSNRSPISNVVSATTLGPPDIDVSPSALSAALLTGETVTRTLTLRNQAAGTLDFSLNTHRPARERRGDRGSVAFGYSAGGEWFRTTPVGRLRAVGAYELHCRSALRRGTGQNRHPSRCHHHGIRPATAAPRT
jgi:hypothetical protein